MRRSERAAIRDAPRGVFRSVVRLIDAVLPGGCAICSVGVSGAHPPVCRLCASRVRLIPPPLCPRCGITRVLALEVADRCPECDSWPDLVRTASACLHEGVAADLVRGLKYRGYTALAPFLAGRMKEPARRLAADRSPVLVPVPLARSRQRERGFNQAELLARELSSSLGWPMSRLLVRPAGGPALARRGRQDRTRLAVGSYALDDRSCSLLEGRFPEALIVDDVITTGATATACAEVLARAGLNCLGAVSFARTRGRL